MNIDDSTHDLYEYINKSLNKQPLKNSNDEPTPTECIEEMVDVIPKELWKRKDLRILDPCCGFGNFFAVIFQKLKEHHEVKDILENILHFNDTNVDRLKVVREIFKANRYSLQVSNDNFLLKPDHYKYDLVVANPPYAKLTEDGKRASKNHNLIKDFIRKTLEVLKPGGYLLFITPDNWMSLADRNTLIKEITRLQIIHLDIHSAKKHFKKVGSSFTWYCIQNVGAKKDFTVTGIWNKKEYTSIVKSQERSFIPLVYTDKIQSICNKVFNSNFPKFGVETSSDLHKYTKKDLISTENDKDHPYKLIHTPKQTVYSTRPHKFQEGYKVFISTTDKYSTFVDNCGMTQSIAFIRCETEDDAKRVKSVLDHPLFVFLNNICRWGNFNNVRILQSFPVPENTNDILGCFKLTQEEINIIYNDTIRNTL